MSSCVLASEGKSKNVLLPVVLKGPNYLVWSRTLRTGLGGKGLWEHVLESKTFGSTKGKEKEGEESDEEAKWIQEDLKVLSILQSSLDPPILEAYSYCESAKELWDTLKTVYGNLSSLHRVFEVKKALNELSQGEIDFNKHLGKFQSLWSELEMLRPITTNPVTLKERRDEDKIFGLLFTLNPIFNDLIKHILREDKLPSMENLCLRIHKEQGSVDLFGAKKELVLANKAEFKGSYSKEARRCEHCKKDGHFKKDCWILNPHLKPTWRNGPRTKERAMNAQVDNSQVNYVKMSDLEALIKTYASK